MSFLATIQANIDNFSQNLDTAKSQMESFTSNIKSELNKLSSTFDSVGKKMSIAITAPLAIAGTAAYNMAADFEDALGATDQIFKESSESVKEWASGLETYFGISKKEALEYENLMGSMLINIGRMTEEQASKQGQKLIELAGDLTAMYGGRTQDAVRALTGALKGNNTMLDNYGMAVNDALVKTRAFELGLIKQGEEMSLSAKQAATLSLIYEQTTAAQGQAAREAEGSSGAMRAFRTEIANLSTELGEHLLPIITPVINRIKEMMQGFRALPENVQRNIVAIAGIAAAIGPLLVGLGSIIKIAPLVGTAFTTMTGPIGIAVAVIGAAALLIIKNWDKIKEYFTTGSGGKLWESISAGASALYDKLKVLFERAKALFTSIWEKIGTNIKNIVGNTFDTIFTIVDLVINNITGAINVFSALLRGDFSGALKAIKETFANIFNSILRITTNVLSSVTNQISAFLKLVGKEEWGASMESWANSLKPVKEATEAVKEEVEKSTEAVKGNAKSVQGLNTELENVTKATKDYKSELIDSLASLGYYDYAIQSITNRFNKLREVAKKAGAELKAFDILNLEETKEIANRGMEDLLKLESRLPKFEVSTDSFIDYDAIDRDMKEASKVVNERFNELRSSVETLSIELSEEFMQGLTFDFASSIGESLANGANIINAIGESLVKSIGTIAKEVGSQMIKFGIAAISLKNLMKNPYLAIAAGTALVALGSMAGASVSKTINSGGYSSASTGVTESVNRDYSQFRGALYNNDRQQVELTIKGNNLVGALNINQNRNNRLG